MPAVLGGEIDDFFFQIQQSAQGEIEEVAAAAGGVEHAEGGEAAAEGYQRCKGVIAFFTFEQFFGISLDGLPFAAQGLEEDGLDDAQDIGGGSVVGAELGALGGIEGALEEGAEDGGVDIAPVLPDGLLQVEEGGAAQLDGFGMVEEVAVEMGDFDRARK